MTIDLDEHLAAIAAGDHDAFGRWVAGAEPELRRSLGSFARLVDTEAVMQEGLLRIWQTAPRYSGDGRANGLLRLGVRVVRNLAIDEARRQRVATKVLAELALDVSDEVQPAVADPYVREAVAHCRDQLRGQPAKALAARLDGPAVADDTLAQGVGMRLNTFLQNITRARKLLGACLRGKGVEMGWETP